MFRLFIRFIGLLLLAGAFAALVVDGTRSLAAGAPALLPLGRTASILLPTGFAKFRSIIETHAPQIWDPVMVTIFLLPTWVVLGAIGLFFLAVTRRRAPKIGYSRR